MRLIMKKFNVKIVYIVIISLAILFVFTNCENSSDNDSQQTELDNIGVIKEYESADGLIHAYVSYPKKEISIIEELKIVLEIQKPEDVIVIFPSKEDISLSHFTITDISSLDTEASVKDGVDRLKKSFTLTPEAVGEGSIDSIKIKYRLEKNKDDNSSSLPLLETDKIIIPIISYTGIDSADVPFKDKLRPESIEPDYTHIIIILVIIGSVLLLVGVALLIIYKLKKNKKGKKDIVIVLPHVRALKALKRLKNEELIEKGEIELFHQRLSNILREYIEGKFNIHAPEQTTEEFIWEMTITKRIDSEYQVILKNYLKQCDLIKFARYQPPTEYHEEAWKIAENFVKNTTDTEIDSSKQSVSASSHR